MNCPMCGEMWNGDTCATCGWSERLDPVNRQRRADAVCEHGTAMDVHCCGCHSGFLFDVAACNCLREGR